MSSKGAIMTFNQAINYGAVLQMYALQRTINKIGYECDVIDYRSPSLTELYRKRNFKDWVGVRQLYNWIFRNSYIRYNYKGFSEFIKNHIKMSQKTYYTKQDLDGINDLYDWFIAGSDQVFNLFCSNFDKNYFLTFVKDSNKKKSYAASLGLEKIPDELEDEYYELLHDFNVISIREQTGARVLEKLLNKECVINIDPTLLLEKKDWDEIVQHCKCQKPYILVYVLSEDKALFNFARKLAKRENKEIIYVNDRYFKRTGMKNLRNVSPEEWLGLLMDADAIVTNSFHGITFSVRFEKKFYPFLLNKNQRVNSRIVDFLKLFELDFMLRNRIIGDEKGKDIDYSKVNKILKSEKNKSINYLREILKE